MFDLQPPNQQQKILQILKFTTVIFVAVLLGIILLSIPKGVSQPGVVLNLLMTAPDAQPWKQGIVKDFEAKNPGIRINIVEGPNATNLLEDLYTSAFILGDSPYDLINMDVIWTPKFAAAGWLLDLSDRITKEELAVFSTKDIEGGRIEGKLYRIPMRSDVGVLYYREDLLQQASFQPPETFADLLKISQALQQQRKINWGYVWQGRQYEGLAAMFVEILQGFGGFWVNPNTLEVGLDKPETLRAITFLQDTIQQKVSPPGVTTYIEEDTRRFFQSGQAAFLRSWPYVWPLSNGADSPIKGKIGIKAMVSTPSHSGAACLGGWGLGIAKSSKHPEEAWKAIQYFTSEQAQRQFILNAGFVPSRRSLFTDPQIVAKYPHYPQLLEILDRAVLRPPIPQYAQASDILQRYLSAALTNRMNPQKAMQAAAVETKQLLGVGSGEWGVGSKRYNN
ncbi:MAG: ABC transporter substrate-binding protein [Stigonema ocellatum SAG 48.90 = DSM 106950]|nr:ABC transporter substrate-binding protein [Stigonema ocellatum SAG 48.90 = DSM 106950]